MVLRSLEVAIEPLRLKAPFRISGYEFLHVDVVVVTLREGGLQGRGEGAGAYYLGDDASHMIAELDAHRDAIEQCQNRQELREIMRPGGARNAVDCAMWDLEAKAENKTVRQLAGLDDVEPLVTTFTLGADEPEQMAQGARDYADALAIKVKLTGKLELDARRVGAIRAARPDVWLGVDANQGFKREELDELVDVLEDNAVALLEQPLKRGDEASLEKFKSRIPIAADESALNLDDVPGLVGRFDVINIKLDKCGGLTEALMIAEEARRHGLSVMVGNMVGTSLAMAPAFIVGQQCDFVDLDGPTFLVNDRVPACEYRDGRIWCSDEVWGSRAAA